MATIQNINVSQPNDGQGDSLRQSQITSNSNFAELNLKKVEKVSGKDLSANDFTDVLKTKLDGIAIGAQVNVQADVLETDENSPAFIKNFPTDSYLNAFGFLDYANSGADQNAVAGVELKLTNNGLGSYTKLDKAPFGVDSIFDTVTNQFDFSQLSIGDWVDFRPDVNVDLVGTNTSFKLYMKMAIGSPLPWTLNIGNVERKSTDEFTEVPYLGFYIGSDNEKNFPAELYILTDANATVNVNGFLFKIIRHNVNIVSLPNVVHKTGDETIDGMKTFTDDTNIVGFGKRLTVMQESENHYVSLNAGLGSGPSIIFSYQNGENTAELRADYVVYGIHQLPNGSGTIALKETSINFKSQPTYALMIADGTPDFPTIYNITNDENKSYERSTYLWKPDGNREWIATTPDN